MHSLTYLALWAIVCLASAKTIVEVPSSIVDRVRPMEDECIKESGSIPDSLYHLLKNSLPNNDASKKFIWCFGSKAGYLDNNAHINVDKFLDVAKNVADGKDDYVKALKECNQQSGGDLVELAWQMAVCYHEKSPFALSIEKKSR